jgi:hypothetical protein
MKYYDLLVYLLACVVVFVTVAAIVLLGESETRFGWIYR